MILAVVAATALLLALTAPHRLRLDEVTPKFREDREHVCQHHRDTASNTSVAGTAIMTS